MDILEQITTLTEECRVDPNILALIPTGSYGKGAQTDKSDFDCIIIVNENVDELKSKYNNSNSPLFEINVLSLSDFSSYALSGTANEWDAYNFAHIKPLVDKTNGKLQQIIDNKSLFNPENINSYVIGTLDAYINSVYRALKNNRDGYLLASKLDAIDSINFLLNAVFALNGKVRPFNKYLEFELRNYPLQKLPCSADELLTLINSLLNNYNTKDICSLFEIAYKLFTENGYKNVFDGWNEKIDWIRNFISN